MRYLLLIYGDEASWASQTPQEQEAEMGAWNEYTKWLGDQGWMRGGEALVSTQEATTVRVRDGKTLTTDGPFAETKEQLGGYYLIECGNLDQAIEAASKIPSVGRGSLEIRPIMELDSTGN
jgi:hypothetical protein